MGGIVYTYFYLPIGTIQNVIQVPLGDMGGICIYVKI